MAQVSLSIGGRVHVLTCRDGEEARLHELAAIVDAKARAASQAVGSVNDSRQLLLAALLLAEELDEARAGPATVPDALERIAARVEGVAKGLEAAVKTS